jgi:hypothetical protein
MIEEKDVLQVRPSIDDHHIFIAKEAAFEQCLPKKTDIEIR